MSSADQLNITKVIANISGNRLTSVRLNINTAPINPRRICYHISCGKLSQFFTTLHATRK